VKSTTGERTHTSVGIPAILLLRGGYTILWRCSAQGRTIVCRRVAVRYWYRPDQHLYDTPVSFYWLVLIISYVLERIWSSIVVDRNFRNFVISKRRVKNKFVEPDAGFDNGIRIQVEHTVVEPDRDPTDSDTGRPSETLFEFPSAGTVEKTICSLPSPKCRPVLGSGTRATYAHVSPATRRRSLGPAINYTVLVVVNERTFIKS